MLLSVWVAEWVLDEDPYDQRLGQANHSTLGDAIGRDKRARLGGSAGVITPKSHTPVEAVAIMTGATTLQKG